MILPYLIKSTLCFGLLFTFYKLVLEHKPMHQFKRFYLLLAIVFSFTLPLITFTYEVETVTDQQWIADFAQGYTYGIETDHLEPVEKQSDHPATILWFVYGAGVVVFGTRYMLNLVRLKRKIARSEQLQEKEFTLSLLKQAVIPHSFLHWIFLNKTAYLHQEIAPEILAHEATHVRQKHSWDILFIELVQVIFWFNPLLWYSKKTIKLNHEFLADQGAINNSNIAIYQKILLSYASSSHHTALESPFNYSLTKKRMLMLSQTFSRKRAVLSALILIPVIGICLFLFNNEIKAQQKKPSHSEYSQQFIEGAIKNNKKPLVIEITNDQIKINGQASSLSTFQKDIDAITSDWEETDYTDSASSFLFKNNSEHFLLAAEREYVKTHISIANGGSKLLPPPPPSPEFPQDATHKKGDTLTITVTDTGEKFKAVIGEVENDSIKMVLQNELDKAQKPATQKEVETYNRLAKKYAANPNGTIIAKEVNLMQSIYQRMSESQKRKAEPYPSYAPPPPPLAPVPKPPPPTPSTKKNAAVQDSVKGKKIAQIKNESRAHKRRFNFDTIGAETATTSYNPTQSLFPKKDIPDFVYSETYHQINTEGVAFFEGDRELTTQEWVILMKSDDYFMDNKGVIPGTTKKKIVFTKKPWVKDKESKIAQKSNFDISIDYDENKGRISGLANRIEQHALSNGVFEFNNEIITKAVAIKLLEHPNIGLKTSYKNGIPHKMVLNKSPITSDFDVFYNGKLLTEEEFNKLAKNPLYKLEKLKDKTSNSKPQFKMVKVN